MKGENAGEVNEALMELGATVCRPVDPACDRCPLVTVCEAQKIGRQQDFPAPRKRRGAVFLRWVAACIIDEDGRWLVRRIDDGPILRGLWLPPLAELVVGADPVCEALQLLPFDVTSAPGPGSIVRHNITHRKIDVLPFRFDTPRFDPPRDEWRWVDPKDPGLPTSSLLHKLVSAFQVKS
jgi:A/G-specific adenine glycosylase